VVATKAKIKTYDDYVAVVPVAPFPTSMKLERLPPSFTPRKRLGEATPSAGKPSTIRRNQSGHLLPRCTLRLRIFVSGKVAFGFSRSCGKMAAMQNQWNF